ncbi:WXG100 family type VII secretion target [Mycolicibacterium sp. XJ662]
MTVIGADPDQLRATANQFMQAADRLQGSLKGLNSFVSNAAIWRGPDSERFRSEWNGQSIFALNGAINALRAGAEVLRRNADEQENASRADAAGGTQGANKSDAMCYRPAPKGLNGMWDEIQDIPKESSGYRVQKVIGADKVERYIVYIAGTDAAKGQTLGSNAPAIYGELDQAQFDALKRLIPEGADVMLVGYSQGGIDAQNIAARDYFNVEQIVTYGSPIRNDLNVDAIHLQYSEDLVPHLSLANPGLYSAAAQDGNENVEVFSSQPNLLTVFGLGEHAGGYGDLSEKWDDAASQGTDVRAAESADGLKKFQGDIVGQVDIDVKGNGSW